MSTSAKYSIKDLEILSDVKSHTIRIWEKRYGILQPGRSGTNIRYYNNEDLKKILNIRFLNQSGVKISRIAEMSELEISRQVQILYQSSTGETQLIEHLVLALIELDESRFTGILHAAIGRLGFEQAVATVVFPFFERIGIMWQTGAINPAQEHFVSNLVRQKIIAATDALPYSPRPELPKIVLFLPETELHEIGLLFYNYALRNRGYPTVYLGQALPLDSLARIVAITAPDVLVCSLINSMNTLNISDILNKIGRVFAGKIRIAGRAADSYTGKLPSNVIRFADLETLCNSL